MGEHIHGKMDVTEQEKTYAGFIKAGIWLVVICILVLLFMAAVNA